MEKRGKPPVSAEQEKPRGTMVQLFELSDAQLEELRKRIDQFKGLVWVFVHPYYDKHEGKGGGAWGGVNAGHVAPEVIHRRIERVIQAAQEKSPASFFLEEREEIADLTKRLKDKIRQPVYVVPTVVGAACPDLVPSTTGGDVDTEVKNWKMLIDKFKSLHVKKILLGGMILDIGEDEEATDTGCVAGAKQALAHDFAVKYSPFTYPMNGRTMR